MQLIHSRYLAALAIGAALTAGVAFQSAARADSQPAPQQKDWTVLVFLNGNNSLDSFGKVNIKQMEKVGSTDALNIVVQWASLENKKVQRLLVQKSTDPDSVTSPIVQDMGQVDMGVAQSLTDFIAWGAQHYPAKHYMVDVWDHGSGWHAIEAMHKSMNAPLKMMDISLDESTGHSMTTVQLAQALRDGAKAIGHKIDLYSSDACLMAMAEIASQVSDSVAYYAGSQEVEPGAGWPYDTFMQRWTSSGYTEASDVAKALSEEYVKSYQGGENGSQEVTFSAYDLSKLDAFQQAIKKVGAEIKGLDANGLKSIVAAAQKTQTFTDSDYGDLLDFLSGVQSRAVPGIDSRDVDGLRAAAQAMIISNHDTDQYKKATGLSIWLPTDQDTYNQYSQQYQGLTFGTLTGWGDALGALVAAATPPSGGSGSPDSSLR